jgi:DNA-binding MarR family transcriptional regulator
MPTTETLERAAAMERFGQAFKGAFAAVRRLRGREGHRPGELSHAQYQVLFELFQRGELPVGELASCADMSPASISEMLDRLADMGLVERGRSNADRRVVVCSLTAAGRRRCEERHARIAPLWEAALERYTGDELALAADVLESLRGMFERLHDHGD